jgi:hypothetical protein
MSGLDNASRYFGDECIERIGQVCSESHKSKSRQLCRNTNNFGLVEAIWIRNTSWIKKVETVKK